MKGVCAVILLHAASTNDDFLSEVPTGSRHWLKFRRIHRSANTHRRDWPDRRIFGKCSNEQLQRAFDCWSVAKAYRRSKLDIRTELDLSVLLNEPTTVSFDKCCLQNPRHEKISCWTANETRSVCCRCFPGIKRVIAAARAAILQFERTLRVHGDLQALVDETGNATAALHALQLALLPDRPFGALHYRLRDVWSMLSKLHAVMDGSLPHLSNMHHMLGNQLVLARARRAMVSFDNTGRLANLFTGSWDAAHVSVFAEFPPSHAPVREGHLMDFLGATRVARCAPGDVEGVALLPGRAAECLNFLQDGLARVYPSLDEEYFEWVAVLRAASLAARRGEDFRMAEIGSAPHALWATRAALAFDRVAAPQASCTVVAIDGDTFRGGSARFEEHMRDSLPIGRCRFAGISETVGTPSSQSVLSILDTAFGEVDKLPTWSLLDFDCQTAELQIVRNELEELSKRVRMLHISTHTREIHAEVLGRLREAGWVILVQFAPHSAPFIPGLGSFVCRDGHITTARPGDVEPGWQLQ